MLESRTICAATCLMIGLSVDLLSEVKGLKSIGEAKTGIVDALSAKGVDSEVAERTLENDRPQVEAAVKNLVGQYSKQEANQRAAWAWFWLRIGQKATPVSESLDSTTVQTMAHKLGTLTVKSQPSGATFTIDEVASPDRTDAGVYVESGARRVRVQMSGYAPAERECDVKAGATTTFSAVLHRTTSAADCQ